MALAGQRFFMSATAITFALVSLLVALCLAAPYQIASDQSVWKYRMIDNTAYFEFPQQYSLLSSIATSITKKHLISVGKCDDVVVATLSPLSIVPIFLENNIVDEIGFRRFPLLKSEYIKLNIDAIVGTGAPIGTEKRQSIGLEFGYSDTDASFSLTQIFPRSRKCVQNKIPLLPILEVLPWNADDVSSLVRMATKVEQIRQLYPNHTVTLDTLRQLRIRDDSSYSALMDFVTYSLMYRMFDGNIFAQMRAHLGDAICGVVNGHPSAFSGPFGALSENFIQQLVAVYGDRIGHAAPSCHVSEELLASYRSASSDETPSLPFTSTFERCLKSEGSMAKCLAQNDRPYHPGCDRVECNSAKGQVSDETLFENYDEIFFDDLVVTELGRTVPASSVKPSECPNFRDKEETQHFVDWWIGHAREIVKEPAECSSKTWRSKLDKSTQELHDAQSCAANKQIVGEAYEAGADISGAISWAKCGEPIDIEQLKARSQEEIFKWLDHIGTLNDRLIKYSVAVGNSETQSLVEALRSFQKIKAGACGTSDLKSCIEDYQLWNDIPRLIGKVGEALGITDTADPKAIVVALVDFNNTIINIAICDALQDSGFSELTGYDRTNFCDTHGLAQYRMIGAGAVVHSVYRQGDVGSNVDYLFQSNGADKTFHIEKFLDR